VATVLRAARPDVLVACEGHGLLEEPRRLADLAAAVGLRARVAPSPDGAHVVLFTRGVVAVPHFEAVPLPSSRTAAVAVVRLPGLTELLVAGCHLDAHSPEARLHDTQALLARLPVDWPRVVLGDLNQLSHEDGLSRRDLLALPLHHVDRHVAADGEPDVRVTRALAEAGLVNAWRLSHPGAPAALGHTVPTAIPQPPRFAGMRIDYAWLSADLPAVLLGCEPWREPPAPHASDHFPLVVDLEPHAP